MDFSGILYNFICKANSEYTEEDYTESITSLKTLGKEHPALADSFGETEKYVNTFFRDPRPFAALIKATGMKQKMDGGGMQVGGGIATMLMFFLCGTKVLAYMMEIHNRIRQEGAGDKYAAADRLVSFLLTIVGAFTGSGWFVVFFKLITVSVGRMMLAFIKNDLRPGHDSALQSKIRRFINLVPPLCNLNRFLKFSLIMMASLTLKAGFMKTVEVFLPLIGVTRFETVEGVIVGDRGPAFEIFQFVILPQLASLFVGLKPPTPTGSVPMLPIPVSWERFRQIFAHLAAVCTAISEDREWRIELRAAGYSLLGMIGHGTADGFGNVAVLTGDALRITVSAAYRALTGVFSAPVHLHQQGGGQMSEKTVQTAYRDVCRELIADLDHLADSALKNLDYTDLFPTETLSSASSPITTKVELPRLVAAMAGGDKKKSKQQRHSKGSKLTSKKNKK